MYILKHIRLLSVNPNQPVSSSQARKKGPETPKGIANRARDIAVGEPPGRAILQMSPSFKASFSIVWFSRGLSGAPVRTRSRASRNATPVAHCFSLTLLSRLGRSLLRQIAPCPRQQPTSPPPFQHPFYSLSATPVLCTFLQLPSARDSPLLTS